MLQRFDTVVVGLGAMGSAALFHLSQRLPRGQVLGLEAQPQVAHDQGSSHGLSRIIRLAYQEHPDYVPLLQRAYALWRELERATGASILTVTGCLDCSPPSGALGTPHGHTCFEGSLMAARQHRLAHEVLTGQQVNERFPGYRLPQDFQALYQPVGGLLAPGQGIRAHVAAAQQRGAQVVCGTKVLSWRPATCRAAAQEHAAATAAPGSHSTGAMSSDEGRSNGSTEETSPSEEGVVLDTEGPGGARASYWARQVVMTPGPWLGALVPELQALLRVERQVVGWFQVLPRLRDSFQPDRFPVFLLQDDRGYYYGFPADDCGFKIGKYHHRFEVADPDSISREVSPEDERVLRECVERYFPGAAGRLANASVCMFTCTPDEHFILDLHPRHPQVVLGSACSGHGYKFAPVVGEILADLALSGATGHEIGFLRLGPGRPGHAEFLARCARPGYGGARLA